jgi:aminopeptidase
MPSADSLEKYARLLIHSGVNLQKGQLLVVRAPVEQAAFVRLCAHQAYQAGAGHVEVEWQDEPLRREQLLGEEEAQLQKVPSWQTARTAQQQAEGCAYLVISSGDPDAFRQVDPRRLELFQAAARKAFEPYDAYTLNNHGQWCVAAAANPLWAKKMFPQEGEKAALEHLWAAILDAVYVQADNDPEDEWVRHSQILHDHCARLNALALRSIHFTNGLGTDLTVALPRGHKWGGGSEKALDRGCEFQPNMPTEEVFTTPARTGVDGVVYASRPLVYQGRIVDHFWLRFAQGRVVDYDCQTGRESLENILNADEHSRYLGEVALVPYDSPISKQHLLFYDTLFDENAACHLALGASYPGQIEGGEKMTEEELLAHDANVSLVHEDFMFGTSDLKAVGLDAHGQEVPLFEKGNFVF